MGRAEPLGEPSQRRRRQGPAGNAGPRVLRAAVI